MPVYVDDYKGHLGRMVMCHMMADTETELDTMAEALGLRLEWKQHHPRGPHFDLSLSKRRDAIARGAIEITTREMVVRFPFWGERGKPGFLE